MWKLGGAVLTVLIAISFPVVFGFPYDDLMQEQTDDTALVESTIREARAVRPQNINDLLSPGVKEAYIHTYGDEPDAEGNAQGYLKKMNDKGDDGYKHFDSYHKKDSDKFAFEVHSEFGKLDKADVDTDGGKHEETKENSETDDGEETKKSYKVVEDPESGSSYYDESGESQNYADGESEAEEEEEESSPHSSYSEDGDGDDEKQSYEEKSSYSSKSDDGDEESEGYSEDGDDED